MTLAELFCGGVVPRKLTEHERLQDKRDQLLRELCVLDAEIKRIEDQNNWH